MLNASMPNRNPQPAILLWEGHREDGKVKTRTLANLRNLAPETIEALKAVLNGASVDADPISEISCVRGMSPPRLPSWADSTSFRLKRVIRPTPNSDDPLSQAFDRYSHQLVEHPDVAPNDYLR